MKISVNDVEVYTLTEIQKKVIQNDIASEDFDADMKRRLKWVLFDEKYCRCMERLKTEWIPKLKAAGVTSVPLDDDAFAQLVFARPEYKNRSQRDALGIQEWNMFRCLLLLFSLLSSCSYLKDDEDTVTEHCEWQNPIERFESFPLMNICQSLL